MTALGSSYELPAHWSHPLVMNDWSQIDTDEEQRALEKFVKELEGEQEVIVTSTPSREYARWHEAWHLYPYAGSTEMFHTHIMALQ